MFCLILTQPYVLLNHFLQGVMVTYRFTIEITTYAAIMSNSSGQIFLFLNFPELRWTAFEVGDTQQLVYSRQHFFPLKNNKKVPKSPKCGAVKRASGRCYSGELLTTLCVLNTGRVWLFQDSWEF